MSLDTVTRSRLFREAFLPGAYLRLRNNQYARVEGVVSGSASLDGLDKGQLREAVVSFIRDWEAAGGVVDKMLQTATEKRALEIQSPTTIYVTPAPLLLTCKKCQVIDFYYSSSQIGEKEIMEKIKHRIKTKQGRRYVACKRSSCDGEMIQLPYVAVHRCGHLSTLRVHHSARRAENIGYKDAGSFFHSQFFDVDTGDKLAGSLQEECSYCAEKNFEKGISKRGTPITSGDAFFTQTIQYIALSEKFGKQVADVLAHAPQGGTPLQGNAKDLAHGIVGGLIGLYKPSKVHEGISETLNPNAAAKPDPIDAQQRLDKIMVKLFASNITDQMTSSDDIMEDLLIKERDKLRKLLEASRGLFSDVQQFVRDEETLKDILSTRRSVEAVYLQNDVKGSSVDESTKAFTDPVQSQSAAMAWDSIKGLYSVEQITHIPDLKVVLSAVGFTREKANPSIPEEKTPPLTLNGFVDKFDPSMRGKTPVYALPARTEALWIRLDPQKVLAWCKESVDWDIPDGSVLTSRAAAHGFLLEKCRGLTMSPGKVLAATQDDHKKYNAPFHLLHTISHSLMLTARRYTGYDSKTVQEYLLPADLSFILYVSSVQNYTAGGLLTLFNHFLKKWFDEACMFSFSCAFDPVCTDNGSSCSGCTQIELGCETFNHGLSRAYLHGGAIDRDGSLHIKKGFWDAR